MRRSSFITLFLLAFTPSAQAQKSDPWIRFIDRKSGLIGYKNLKGKTMIAPRFGQFTVADTFYNIIAVHEERKEDNSFYYMLKDGRTISSQNVYLFDFRFDCESEGRIRFSNRAAETVGFFDKEGKVAIPATYNWATPFHNGLSVAKRGAIKTCPNNVKDCEHHTWKGGETLLINTNNEILVTNLPPTYEYINWYTLKITHTPADTTLYTSFRADNGSYYNFLDYQKEFTNWYNQTFLKALTNNDFNKLTILCFSEITVPAAGDWKAVTREEFLNRYPFKTLQKVVENAGATNYSTTQTTLNYYTLNRPLYRRYYTACNEYNKERYPVFEVIHQSHATSSAKNPTDAATLQFLRTDSGYRLVSADIQKQ
jgi:hypothetical protein